MESGSTHLHVVPSLDRGWTLREVADGPALRRKPTRRGVLDVAGLMLARRRGGRISDPLYREVARSEISRGD